MRGSKTIFYYSLLAVLASMPTDGICAIRVGNKSRSYAAAYEQVNAIRNPGPAVVQIQNNTVDGSSDTNATVATSNDLPELPIRVANSDLANQIANGYADDNVSMAHLERCGMIYPDGEFAWDTPTAGLTSGGPQTCVAVVEMRGYQMAEDGSDLVVASVMVPAGQSIPCNISQWPEYSYLPSAEQITFPSDTAPTIEDVKKIMNIEQKQNAGLKIAAGTIVAAVGGNMLGKNAVGETGLIGTNREKLTATAIGGVTGAAIMAGNVYAGKVAGDMILSAGVNAAAGGLIGNMGAAGDSVLRIEKCKLPDGSQDTCLWGVVVEGGELKSDSTYYYNIIDEDYWECPNDTTKQCMRVDLIDLRLDGDNRPLYELSEEHYNSIKSSYYMDANKKMVEMSGKVPSQEYPFAKIASGKTRGKTMPAMIAGFRDRPFGARRKDWEDFSKDNQNATVYGRQSDGNAYVLTNDKSAAYTIGQFYPVYQDASDGGLIDLNNKARLKATLIGAGAGGAMGAFSAYQGAQTDIENRWVTEVQQYKDSLTKVYCGTGDRFLSQYNDLATIPALVMPTEEQE